MADRMPELPLARRRRFVDVYGLSADDAGVLTSEREIADTFEEVVGTEPAPERARTAANWIVNDVLGLQRARGLPPERLPLTAAQLGDLLDALAEGELTARAAKELLPRIEEGESPRAAAARLDLLSLDDEGAIGTAIAETLAAFPGAVADYRTGKTAAIGRLIGETIKRTGGRAKPDQVRRLLEQVLKDG
jgi:aspartyl-tRNA(Asn)/glutamyl-tRNA(Gln) amidotransferase subunit B